MKNEEPKCVCSPNCKKAKKVINPNNSKKAKDRQNRRQPLHLKNLNRNANANETDDRNENYTNNNNNQRSLGVSQNRDHLDRQHQRRQQQQRQQHPHAKKNKKMLQLKTESESAVAVVDGGADDYGTLPPPQKKEQQHRLNVRQFDNHGVRHKNKKLANNSRNVASKRRHINLMYHDDLRHGVNLNDTETVLQITEKRIRGGDLMNNFIAMSENNFINDNSILVSNGPSSSIQSGRCWTR